jgi:hypothetical protein
MGISEDKEVKELRGQVTRWLSHVADEVPRTR